jgi:hypothetical protein
MIKYIFLSSLSLLVLTSCASSKRKNKQTVTTEVNQELMQENILWTEGVVRVSSNDSDCPLVIELVSDSRVFYPLGLDEKYKIDGLKIKFTYSLSRAPLPEKCYGKVAVILDSIEL